MIPSRVSLAVAGAAVLLAVEGQSMSTTAIPYAETFREVAGIRWLDRAAQVKAESNFNPNAVSYILNKEGKRVPCAYGVAQFTLPTWETAINKGWAPVDSTPLNPFVAIPAQHFYMRSIEAHFPGDWPKALGSYNAGRGNIQEAERRAEALGYSGSEAWLKELPSVTGKDHAAETAGYVRRIKVYRDEYRKAGLR
jgi:hypothetical protein